MTGVQTCALPICFPVTIITFIVGTRINEANQDPRLPVELEMRRSLIKRIKDLLEQKYLKEVDVEFI